MAFEPHLHWSFREEHVLLPSLVLNSFWSFLLACLLVIFICLMERFLTILLEKQWSPHMFKLSRIYLALWRTALYAFVTFLRLSYMLIAMTYHLGLILTIVLSLSTAQFVIELQALPKPTHSLPRNTHDTVNQPLLPREERVYPLKTVQTRPRSKSKPDDIFIHPTDSNIARADAVAQELGISGDTERVKGHSYPKDEPAWEIGKGRDVARELLGPKKKTPSQGSFYIGDDSESDS